MKQKQRTLWTCIFLIIISGCISYANCLKGEFIWDDETLVRDNLYLRDWSHLPKIFTEDVGAGAEKSYRFWRPLQTLTYMLDYSFWKLDVRGYHLTNIALHILAALTLFWWLNLLFSNWRLSFLASLFFVLHPVHTEAVAYISGRSDALVNIFILLSFVFYIKSLRLGRIAFYLLAISAYALALLSRENSLIFPILLLLYHFTFRVKLKVKQFVPLAAMALGYILLRLTALSYLLGGVELAYASTNLWQRLPGFLVAIAEYFRLLFAPFHLHMVYGKVVFNFAYYKTWVGLVILLLLCACALVVRKRNPLVFFGLFWFLITLLPSSNLYPINAYMAEHWLYLPAIGFFLILAYLLSWLYQRKGLKPIAIAVIVAIVGFFSILTIKQNRYWQKAFAFYETTLRYAPFSPKMHVNLGIYYDEHGKSAKAIPLYQKAIEINPQFDKAHYNLGNAYYHLKQYPQAEIPYRKAIELNSNYYKAYNNLGLVYKAQGKNAEAIKSFERAIAVKPYHLEAYNNLGLVYKAMGDYQPAIALFNKAIALRPTQMEPYNNLAAVYRQLGQYEEAEKILQQIIQFQPDCLEAYFNLGNVYLDLGKEDQAISFYQKALQLNPAYAPAHYSLAKAFFVQQQYQQAIAYFDRAQELGFPVSPEFLNLLKPHRK